MDYIKMTNKLILIGSGAMMFWSCSAYKAKKQEAQLAFPELGTLIKTSGDLWYSAAEQIGIPDWTDLKIDVQQLPFNRKSYTAYARHMQRANKINSIAYNDSLPYKPKYLRLQLLDQLGIAHLLNRDDHNALRNYISHDDSYKLVTALDITVPEKEMPSFLQAEAVRLQKDGYGNIVLAVVSGEQKKQYFISELQIFGYGYANFCWGEDRYHNAIVQNIVSEGQRCPKGTYLKSSKVDRDKAYLKF